MRRSVLTGLALGVSLCAFGLSLWAQSDTTAPSVPKGLHAPGRIGRYVRGDVHDYGTTDLGAAIQYKPDRGRDSSYATLYLYARNSEEIGWSGDSVASYLGHAFKDALEVQVSRGIYDRYSVVFEGRDSITTGTTVYPGYYVTYVFRRNDAVAVSFLYLYVVDQALVKIRGTVPSEHWEETDLPSFAHDIAIAAIRPVAITEEEPVHH
jgi:hypothetical protein